MPLCSNDDEMILNKFQQLQFPYGGPPRREDSQSPFLKLSNTIPYQQSSANSIPLNNIQPTPTSRPGWQFYFKSHFTGLLIRVTLVTLTKYFRDSQSGFYFATSSNGGYFKLA